MKLIASTSQAAVAARLGFMLFFSVVQAADLTEASVWR